MRCPRSRSSRAKARSPRRPSRINPMKDRWFIQLAIKHGWFSLTRARLRLTIWAAGMLLLREEYYMNRRSNRVVAVLLCACLLSTLARIGWAEDKAVAKEADAKFLRFVD